MIITRLSGGRSSEKHRQVIRRSLEGSSESHQKVIRQTVILFRQFFYTEKPFILVLQSIKKFYTALCTRRYVGHELPPLLVTLQEMYIWVVATQYYNQSYISQVCTINTGKELLNKAIWAAKNGLIFGRLACTSSIPKILRNIIIQIMIMNFSTFNP